MSSGFLRNFRYFLKNQRYLYPEKPHGPNASYIWIFYTRKIEQMQSNKCAI